jgi:hypothetical protein
MRNQEADYRGRAIVDRLAVKKRYQIFPDVARIVSVRPVPRL